MWAFLICAFKSFLLYLDESSLCNSLERGEGRVEQSAARGRYREITLYLLPPSEMSNIDAILLAADELVYTNEYTIITLLRGNSTEI